VFVLIIALNPFVVQESAMRSHQATHYDFLQTSKQMDDGNESYAPNSINSNTTASPMISPTAQMRTIAKSSKLQV
jgi:hypothetical protein